MDSRTLTESEVNERNAALAACVPAKLWLLLTGALERKCSVGSAWVKAGRPRQGTLHADFCDAERKLENYRYRVDRFPWSKEQSAEWTAIHRRFDP